MDITPDTLVNIYTAYDTAFQAAFTRAKPWWSKVAYQAPSSTRVSVHSFLGQMPALRQVTGERIAKSIAAKGHSVTNLEFESTIEVKRADIEDDQYGVYTPAAAGLGMAAAKWPDLQLATYLKNAKNTAHWDGVNFFATNHPQDVNNSGAGTYSNLYSGGSAKPLTAANYQAVRSAMMQVQGEGGIPLGIVPDLIIVDPTNERAARTIVQADMIPSDAGTAPQSNVLKGSADVLVIPELTEAGVWYLAYTSGAMQPLMFQLRKAPELISLQSPTDPNVVYLRNFLYMAYARGAFTGTLPFLISRCEPS